MVSRIRFEKEIPIREVKLGLGSQEAVPIQGGIGGDFRRSLLATVEGRLDPTADQQIFAAPGENLGVNLSRIVSNVLGEAGSDARRAERGSSAIGVKLSSRPAPGISKPPTP